MTASAERERAGEDTATDAATTGASVLVVADHPNPEKIDRHYGPLADVAGETTMVCVDGAEAVEDIAFLEVPTFGYRLLGLPLIFLAALVEALRGDYDAVVSISLVPYGTFALLVGRLTGTPVHLGIIGADLDSHAAAWYGAVPRALFRRFDAVSVPGTAHVERLAAAGVDRERIAVLTNTVDAVTYRPPADDGERDVDFLWIGRFSDEKRPALFVEALARLRARGVEYTALMLGDGDRLDATRALAAELGVADAVEFTGWVDDPLAYYHRTRAYVLTSRREGVPLTLLEAMATGVVPVVPPVGSVPDVVADGRNGFVVDRPTPARLADALEAVLADDERRRKLADAATAVRETHSYDAAREDWRRILDIMGAVDGKETRGD
jgi:glycosyltransferase involved in cell wall biosynthesis